MVSVVTIQPASAQHLEGMTEIYAHHVLNGTGSFEEVPPDINEMQRRWKLRETGSFPTLVALCDGSLAGFAYAGSYKARSAYRFTVEDSIYVAPGKGGQGIGQALLNDLIQRCEADGYHQMMAVVGDSENVASINLHRRCGFRHIGTAVGLGYKHERWLDIVYMQRSLAAASSKVSV